MANLDNIQIVSFDVEGTLVTTDFSASIWFEGIPGDYAIKHRLSFKEAQRVVFNEYAMIGDQNMEWYDINFWMRKFDLGSSDKFLAKYSSRIQLFPEVIDVLDSLHQGFKLIVASGTPREFLRYLLGDIATYFAEIFSSTSDFKSIKNLTFYREVCQKMQTAPDNILHIGDNLQFDFQHASEAGLHAYYLDRKEEHQGHLKGLKSLAELKHILLDTEK